MQANRRAMAGSLDRHALLVGAHAAPFGEALAALGVVPLPAFDADLHPALDRVCVALAQLGLRIEPDTVSGWNGMPCTMRGAGDPAEPPGMASRVPLLGGGGT